MSVGAEENCPLWQGVCGHGSTKQGVSACVKSSFGPKGEVLS